MNGIILIDKPKEYTSHDVVAIVKKISKEKVGHTGTLDPNATGVLPLLIGKATLLSKYLVNHDKTYIATLKLGIKTDTADIEGKIIEEKEIPTLFKEEIQEKLDLMIGKQEQIPPMYSAIKINGKKLYEYARQGKQIDIEPRKIEIYNMDLVEYNEKEAEIIFEISCSKGTYIRTVCEELAKTLNTVGYMKELRRVKVGEFDIKNSIDIEVLKKNEDMLKDKIITIEKFFENKERLDLNDKELELFFNGVMLKRDNLDDIYRIYNKNIFIGLGEIKAEKLKRDIVI